MVLEPPLSVSLSALRLFFLCNSRQNKQLNRRWISYIYNHCVFVVSLRVGNR